MAIALLITNNVHPQTGDHAVGHPSSVEALGRRARTLRIAVPAIALAAKGYHSSERRAAQASIGHDTRTDCRDRSFPGRYRVRSGIISVGDVR